MMANPTEYYEESVLQIAQLYYGLYVASRQWTDVDCSDLIQAGNIAILKVARRRPEMLPCRAYVKAAIRFGIINEMRKMQHKVKQVYLTRQHEEEIPIIDIFPTKETAPDRLDQLNDLLYQVRQEFSPVEADALDALVQKCSDVYDLNLSAPPSTDTKDRVKVVAAMDLDDEEMMIYAQVLTGARFMFPRGYFQPEKEGKERAQKYLTALLNALEITPLQFAASKIKEKTIIKYRLMGFLNKTYTHDLTAYLQDIDNSIHAADVFHGRKWCGEVNAEELCEKIHQLRKKPERIVQKDFRKNGFGGMLTKVFNGCSLLAVEFAFPGTYPKYQEEALEIWRKYD